MVSEAAVPPCTAPQQLCVYCTCVCVRVRTMCVQYVYVCVCVCDFAPMYICVCVCVGNGKVVLLFVCRWLLQRLWKAPESLIPQEHRWKLGALQQQPSTSLPVSPAKAPEARDNTLLFPLSFTESTTT